MTAGRGMLVVLTMSLGLVLGALPAVAGHAQSSRYAGRAFDLDDGSREGTVTLRVVNRGTQIRGFKTTVTATCINANAIGGIEVVPVPVTIGKIRVKRNGRFARTLTFVADPPSGARQTYTLSGRVLHGKVRGRLALDHRCSDTVRFAAKRVR